MGFVYLFHAVLSVVFLSYSCNTLTKVVLRVAAQDYRIYERCHSWVIFCIATHYLSVGNCWCNMYILVQGTLSVYNLSIGVGLVDPLLCKMFISNYALLKGTRCPFK